MAAKSEEKLLPDKYRVDWDSHEFVVPTKEINKPDDIGDKWEKSEAYQDMLGFIIAMNSQLKGWKMRDKINVSETCQKLLDLLEKMNSWVDEIPPIDQPQRFGNKAFRDWFEKLTENSEQLVKDALPEKFHPAAKEISVYLVEGVGNKTRIDYGTGHEFAFVAFLCCLFKIEALTEEDCVAVVLKVFQRYLELMRRVQTVYRMEPAGSHGVFSLDDYHFMPFLWGSAQLIDHARIRPSHFVEPDYYSGFDKDFMFLSAVKYIAQVKTGPFAEHSNQLWNISGVPLWAKVNSGLVKMFKVEVVSKFPVIQHFLFGSLLSIKPAPEPLKHRPHSAGYPSGKPTPSFETDSSPSHPHKDTPIPDADTVAAATAMHPGLTRPFSSRLGGVKPASTQDLLEAQQSGQPSSIIQSNPPKGPKFAGVDPSLISQPAALRHPVMDPNVASALKQPNSSTSTSASMPPPRSLPRNPVPDQEILKKKASEWSEPGKHPPPERRGKLLQPLSKDAAPKDGQSASSNPSGQDTNNANNTAT